MRFLPMPCSLGLALLLSVSGCGSDESAETSTTAATAPDPRPELQPSVPAEAEVHEAAPQQPSGPPPEVERPYDEDADAAADIEAALALARQDHKRVLLVFGANWCPWCRRLDWVLQNDAPISSALETDFHLVHVDVGERQSDTNRRVVEQYGNPIQHGLPCLVVLDEDGTVAHTQETGSLEIGDRHDPSRVLAFLQRWRRNG